MSIIIELEIEKFVEDWKTYYVATSKEVQGLVAQWDTLKETIDIAEDVIESIFEARKKLFKDNNKKTLKIMDLVKQKKKIWTKFKCPLEIIT